MKLISFEFRKSWGNIWGVNLSFTQLHLHINLGRHYFQIGLHNGREQNDT